jgi:DNA-binding MarR family transcriptional regulator
MVTPSARVEETADLLRRVTRQLRAGSGEDWTSLSLTRAQLKILLLLQRQGAATVGNLASELGVTLPSITATVDRLVTQKLVTREEDPADRRRVINRLTPEGSTLLERLYEGRRVRLIAALNQLSPDEIEALSSALARFEQALQATSAE